MLILRFLPSTFDIETIVFKLQAGTFPAGQKKGIISIASLQETFSIHFQIEMRNDESKTTISSPIQPGHPVHPNDENFSSLSLIAAGSTGVIEIFFSAETKRNFCAT